MHIQHGHPGAAGLVAPFLVMQSKHLYATAHGTVHAPAAAGNQQQMAGVRRAVERHIGGQGFAMEACVRQHMGLGCQPGGGCGFEEKHAGAGIVRRKSLHHPDHAEASDAVAVGRCATGASQASASRTQ